MTRAAVGTLCTVLLLACALRVAQRGHPPAHNPLELWNTATVQISAENSGASIRCNVTVLKGAHTWVEVSWSGLRAGAYDDYIAVFPAGADPLESAPIKYQWAARSPSHLLLGAGATTFRLLNMRQDLRIALVRNGLQFPVIAAWSQVVKVAHPNQPMQGHLSLTGKQGEVMVQWVTRDKGKPAVRWAIQQQDQHVQVAAGDSLTYRRADMCGSPANSSGWMEPGWMHGAVMSELQPSTRYVYWYGDEELGWSEEQHFTSPPAVGPGSSVRLLAVADLGQAEVDGSMEASEMLASLATTARLAAEVDAGAQLLIHNGDISYARGFSSQWDAFWDQLGPTVRRVPYMTTVGNHERDWPHSGDRFPEQYDSGGECGVAYYRRTRMPTAAEDAPWFSFDFGPIHFLQYSTEHAFEPGSEQHAFIERDLASVDRGMTPWVVLGGHRPIYIDSTFYGLQPDGDQHVAQQLRDSLEPLLYRYQVDATWSGHHHSYQRTCPVLRGRCMGSEADGTAKAPLHLVIGHAGAGLTPNVHFLRPRIFKKVSLHHGYMVVEANATHLAHTVLSSFDGSLLDQVTLTKPAGWRVKPVDIA